VEKLLPSSIVGERVGGGCQFERGSGLYSMKEGGSSGKGSARKILKKKFGKGKKGGRGGNQTNAGISL